MRLFVLFAHQPSKPPKAMAVVDQNTIQKSGHEEMAYKKIALEQVKNSAQDVEGVTNWAWFQIDLPPTAMGRIVEYLTSTVPRFATNDVTPSPIETVHPSTEGITVTVGRVPGKIIDDEIRE